MADLKVFDIVSTSYSSIEGDKKTGLFLVIFVDEGNALCAKLTSQFDSRYLHYSVLAYQRTNPFLQIDSYIQLDKLHTISVDNCSVIGSLSPAIRSQVKIVLNRFHYDLLKQINSELTIRYVSPNKHK